MHKINGNEDKMGNVLLVEELGLKSAAEKGSVEM